MLVSRMFKTSDDAQSAVDDLKQTGFGDDRIKVVNKTGEQVNVSYMLSQGVSDEARAQNYADGVSHGKTLVIVDAPLGRTGSAKAILESARTGDADEPAMAYEEALVRGSRATRIPNPAGKISTASQPFDTSVAAPLSTKFNWPVLLDDPAPLSSYFKWKTLSPPPTEKPMSHGLPFLSDNPTPLSSRLGLKVLSDNPTPFSSWFGRKVLSDDPAPLSNKINKPTLLDNPAPLSSWLNIRVLVGDKTYLY